MLIAQYNWSYPCNIGKGEGKSARGSGVPHPEKKLNLKTHLFMYIFTSKLGWEAGVFGLLYSFSPFASSSGLFSPLISSHLVFSPLSICPSTVAVVINDETHNSLLGWDTSACMFKLLPVVSLIWVEINMAFTVTLEGRGPCIDVQMSFQGIWCFCSLFSKEMAWYMSWWCLLAFSRVLLEPGIVWTEIADVKLSDNVVSLQRKMRRKGLGKAVIDFFFFGQESCLN